MASAAPSPQIPDDSVTLPSGGRMPLLGFGTWQIRGREASAATGAALETGYRHVDTATIYVNEAEIGRALRDSGVGREQVFVTTKCPPDRTGRERETLKRSLDLLGTEYVDLWLIHWPGGRGADLEMWRAFLAARDAGLVRDIGVSNYSVAMIDELTSASGVRPAVNQIKWSPLLFDPTVLEEHGRRRVAVEGYSALRGGTLEHPTVRRIAEETGRTPAQVIIRWHLQHGVIAIPKSRNPERIRSNADVAGFELTTQAMAALDRLGSARS